MASYTALYRARAVDTTGRKVTAFVPAVFGEEPITIVDSIGDLPTNPGMGWVFFQAGNPEFPVWVGAQSGGDAGTGGGGDPGPVGLVSYVHVQSAPSSVWTITHNLGWYPNVTVIDSAGSTVEGDITQLNTNTMTIAFSGSFTGKAYLS